MIETKISFVSLHIARLKNCQSPVIIFTFWYGIGSYGYSNTLPSPLHFKSCFSGGVESEELIQVGGEWEVSWSVNPALSSWFLQEFRCVLSPLE